MDHGNSTQSSSFKIKTKKFRSEKTITLNDAPKEEKTTKNLSKVISNKSTKQLPPIEKDTLQSTKSSKFIPSKEPKSMKSIGIERETRRVVIR